MNPTAAPLEPCRDVLQDGHGFIATTDTPWLAVRQDWTRWAGRWVRFRYRAGFFDPLVRPIMRATSGGTAVDQWMCAPVFGKAVWIGRLPEGTTQVLLSPTDRPGRFSFALDECAPVNRLNLLVGAARRNPGRTLTAVLSRIGGMREEARVRLRMALGATPLADYHGWRLERQRPVDFRALDVPRTDWNAGPHLMVVLDASRETTGSCARLSASLASQPYAHWSIAIVAPTACTEARHMRDVLGGRGRIVPPETPCRSAAPAGLRDVVVLPMPPGARLPPYALGTVADHFSEHPDGAFAYADEDSFDDSGRQDMPRFKPDWSPLLARSNPYIGSTIYLRPACCPRIGALPIADLFDGAAVVRACLDSQPARVGHIRRVLLSLPAPEGCAIAPPASVSQRSCVSASTSIIIPSRDRIDLLAPCIDAIRRHTPARLLDIIVVDNGSRQAATYDYYRTLEADTSIRVLPHPGIFNFSAMCNAAARQSRSDILVFLNNDAMPLHEGWLTALVRPAIEPDIGAVGCKLLYASGRLQHGGVVIGLGGYAAHFQRNAHPQDAGYLERLSTGHEVSAVTAACLAVERRKFEAIGGFDSVHFPVDLNDVDICLRLGERGWRTVFTPDSVLRHHESATRGVTWRPSRAYARSHEEFRRRWSRKMRDDPYFHPALSLFSIEPALD